MLKRLQINFLVFCSLIAFIPVTFGADDVAELKKIVEALAAEVSALRQELAEIKTSKQVSRAPEPKEPLDESSDSFHYSDSDYAPAELVSLDEAEVVESDAFSFAQDHVLSKPWWQNFEIYGHAAFGYYKTGDDANRSDGSFTLKEASLFVEADVWENISAFFEVQTTRLNQDNKLYTRTGEVYLHFRDLPLFNESLGVKVGRVDIPFGEEYLWMDAIDNPLITNSVAFPYGWDEGILLYSKLFGVGWVASITDGNDTRSRDDNDQKSINLKFYGNINDQLYASLSLMDNGKAEKSAILFGGSHFEPLYCSSRDEQKKYCDKSLNSPSDFVDSKLIQGDLKYNFGEGHYLALTAGYADQEDDAEGFDRDFSWFSVEPYWQIKPQWYLAGRYSEIGTFDSLEGYQFGGKIFASGLSTYGFDTKELHRWALGLGWTPNPRLRAKLEIGGDHFRLIDSAVRPRLNDRNFIGLELASKF
jgi:hypothetical protein